LKDINAIRNSSSRDQFISTNEGTNYNLAKRKFSTDQFNSSQLQILNNSKLNKLNTNKNHEQKLYESPYVGAHVPNNIPLDFHENITEYSKRAKLLNKHSRHENAKRLTKIQTNPVFKNNRNSLPPVDGATLKSIRGNHSMTAKIENKDKSIKQIQLDYQGTPMKIRNEWEDYQTSPENIFVNGQLLKKKLIDVDKAYDTIRQYRIAKQASYNSIGKPQTKNLYKLK
jgi:hypothetical protein